MANGSERVAQMSPEAVNQAQVFSGRVHFFDGEQVELRGQSFVEVGKWTTAGQETAVDDFDCTYYAALLLGYELNLRWLPTGEDGEVEYRYLIAKDQDEKGRPIPFSSVEANAIVQNINGLLADSKQIKSVQE